MQVKVLQHHIDEGQRMSGTRCAVALALREQFPESAYIHVGMKILISSYGFTTMLDIATPPDALAFIRNFDSYQPVEPFTFELPMAGVRCR